MGNLFQKSITHQEMESFVNDKLAYKDQVISNLRKELEDTRNVYNKLKSEHDKHSLSEIKENKSEPIHSIISDDKINEFVQTILNDPAMNIYLLPDSMEGLIYRNVIKLVLHAVSNLLNSSHIGLLGHELKIVILPESQNK